MALASVHIVRMDTIATILATAAVTASLTWLLARWPQASSSLTHGALAPVWREGYEQGVKDEQYAEEVNFTNEYGRVGPNRANPYSGSERRSGNA